MLIMDGARRWCAWPAEARQVNPAPRAGLARALRASGRRPVLKQQIIRLLHPYQFAPGARNEHATRRIVNQTSALETKTVVF